MYRLTPYYFLTMIHLILGGARSGKSRFAEQQVIQSGKQRLYLATAQALDKEMQQRIIRHQADRDSHWQTVEEPLHLAQQLNTYNSPEYCILIDCLTLWLTNCLLAQSNDCWPQEKQLLLECFDTLQADLILVSNEVGQGIVPMDALSRRFVDEAGWLHQAIAEKADKVSFIAAGLPLTLKP